MQPAQTFGRRGVVAPTPAAPLPVRREAPSPAPQEAPVRAARHEDSNTGFLLNLLFGFEGRLQRSAYRYGRIVSYVIFPTLVFGLFRLALEHRQDLGLLTVIALSAFAVSLLGTWTTIAMQVKRWHDRGKSGVWILISFIPLIGPLWQLVQLVFLEGEIGPNRFGPDPRGDPTAVFET